MAKDEQVLLIGVTPTIILGREIEANQVPVLSNRGGVGTGGTQTALAPLGPGNR